MARSGCANLLHWNGETEAWHGHAIPARSGHAKSLPAHNLCLVTGVSCVLVLDLCLEVHLGMCLGLEAWLRG